ncbi:MAG: methylmalonyl Co-A mutase-associated GTPase MeaB [Deltaproteobacteria bacterium]|nr:methylmalonyl Co-A mutase-associated GTPase MeaB [Deltaproteobacteria bacterium]
MDKLAPKKEKLPEWAPQEGGKGFACHVVEGVEGGHDGIAAYSGTKPISGSPRCKRPSLTVNDYVEGVLKADRAILGRTITLVESNSAAHMELAQKVLKKLLPYTGRSIRIGITGVPGVGKSTFIEAFGRYLLEKGYKPAVLAVDPSSSITGGSILGDKTRMESLSRDNRCFIRPSPSSGTLGGVARKSRETMLVCEAAGYDVLLIETVGVGQSEITVRSMVDFFILLMLAGAGDELQGIKKGIIELADAILITKADGNNKTLAKAARNEYANALHYLRPATEGWQTEVFTCSAVTGEGISKIWSLIDNFRTKTMESGAFESRRRRQALKWMHTMLSEQLRAIFFKNPSVVKALPEIEKEVLNGTITPTFAVNSLINIFEGNT